MSESLSRSRLDSFSDGVLAVLITIMVLELKVPGVKEMSDGAALRNAVEMIAVYLLSFVQIGIYWVNHHYLMDDLRQVTHGVLWANLLLLFTLSFIPFGTEWIGVRGIAPVPVAVYCVCFLAPGVTWILLASIVRRRTGVKPAAGLGKQAFSAAMDVGAIAMAFRSPVTALAMIGVVAAVWLLPPRRIVEKTRTQGKEKSA